MKTTLSPRFSDKKKPLRSDPAGASKGVTDGIGKTVNIVCAHGENNKRDRRQSQTKARSVAPGKHAGNRYPRGHQGE